MKMMTFARIPADFWTTPRSGRLREAGPETMLLAFYLLSNSHANMLGIYYLPFAYASADTGLPIEMIIQCVERLTELGFCVRGSAFGIILSIRRP